MGLHRGATSVVELEKLALSGGLSRRQLVRRALALGLSMPTIAVLVEACGGGGGGTHSPAATAQSTAGAAVSGTPISSSPASAAPSKNQTLIVPVGDNPQTLDPAGAVATGSIFITHNCYEALATPVPGQGVKVEPRLATSWDFTPDAKQVTFHLRQGVKFTDGTLMDAASVKSSFERVLQLNLGNAPYITSIDTIDVVDQFTVRFNLKAPNSAFVQDATQIGIISPTAVKEHDKGGDFSAAWLDAGNTAGTGPYKLTGYTPNVSLTMDAVPEYWRGWGPNHISKVTFPVTPSPESVITMVENGQAHMVEEPPLTDAQRLESNSAVRVIYTPMYDVWFLPMVMTKPPTDNAKVRQAFQYAFDYEGYLNKVWFGHGATPTGPTALNFPGYTSSPPPFKQDLQKAKQLFEEAGVVGQTVTAYYVQSSPEEEQADVILQAAVKELGVNLEVTAMPWSTMYDEISHEPSAPNMTNLQNGPICPDPTFPMLQNFQSSLKGQPYNWSYYGDPKMDGLIDQALASVDAGEQTKLLEEANQLAVGSSAAVWYVNPNRVDILSTKLQNFAPIVPGYPNETDFYAMYLSE